MSEGFSRTLETADRAERWANLLDRSAHRVSALHPDRRPLAELAQVYRDYAAALREAVPAVVPEAEQAGLPL